MHLKCKEIIEFIEFVEFIELRVPPFLTFRDYDFTI